MKTHRGKPPASADVFSARRLPNLAPNGIQVLAEVSPSESIGLTLNARRQPQNAADSTNSASRGGLRTGSTVVALSMGVRPAGRGVRCVRVRETERRPARPSATFRSATERPCAERPEAHAPARRTRSGGLPPTGKPERVGGRRRKRGLAPDPTGVAASRRDATERRGRLL